MNLADDIRSFYYGRHRNIHGRQVCLRIYENFSKSKFRLPMTWTAFSGSKQQGHLRMSFLSTSFPNPKLNILICIYSSYSRSAQNTLIQASMVCVYLKAQSHPAMTGSVWCSLSAVSQLSTLWAFHTIYPNSPRDPTMVCGCLLGRTIQEILLTASVLYVRFSFSP